MKNVFLFLLVCLGSIQLEAQNLGVFEDAQQRFYIFDTDHFIRAEHMPVKDYWVGKNYVAFIRNNGRFTIYFQGKEHEISLADITVRATDNNLVYFVDEQVWLFDGNEIKLLDPWIKTEKLEGNIRTFPSFALSDSIVGFTNSFERFIVAEDNTKQEEIELWDVNHLKAGENIIAYVDNNNVFKSYYKGERHIIEDRSPKSYVPKRDIIAYVDDFGTFKVWFQKEVIELQEIVPARYYVADKMVAYMDDMSSFVCFYNGEVYDILPYKPTYLGMEHNVMVYTDNRDYTYAFYKGKNTRIAAYKPNKIVIEDDLVVFQDLDGYIKAFKNGKLIKVSNEIAIYFEVFNNVVIYKTNEYTWYAALNGKNYQYLP